MGVGEAAAYGSFHCAGVRIDEVRPAEAVAILCGSQYGTARRIHLCNSYTLSVAMRDLSYRQLLNASDLNFADGHYVALVGRWRGGKVMTERVYGPTLMLRTVDIGRESGLKHYLYGADPGTVERLASALRERCPGVEIVGVESPPFRPLSGEEEQALFDRVSLIKPDIFWVGLGTPRQDTFVARYAADLGCTVVPVGAAFDFISGAKRSAPPLAQKLGLEWAFRFASEPVRLWRRYVFGIPIFLLGVATDRWFRGRPQRTAKAAKVKA
jgi:N-acetylglucosaminyldiphosphoundecaprenol N-acetyl-beta-D-mannosaminyltransferase